MEFLTRLPRKVKIAIILVSDVILLPVALWSAIALRQGTWAPPVSTFRWVFIVLTILSVFIFIRIGLYRAVIRYVNEKVVYTVVYGVTLSVLALTALITMARIVDLPRSSILMFWVLAIGYMGVSRFAARAILRRLESQKERKTRIAIYGAGKAGLQTALALLSSNEYKPVAFFDDNDQLYGTSLAGIRVYNPKDIKTILAKKDCNELLLAIPSATRSQKREIVQKMDGEGLILKTLPGLGDLVQGTVRIEDIREVGVEDLLGRDSVPPFEDLISACIRAKVVMVTGAGGSIGSELCRQILKHSPAKLLLLEQSEYSLYKIEAELKKSYPAIPMLAILGDVVNEKNLEYVMSSHRVQTVYHAAAYKHVPMVEANIEAGVMNNVFGTLSAARAARSAGVDSFVLISTDKAVRPTNVMGASKRLAELVLQGLTQQKDKYKTKFCMVRFGNVLGSSGSVVPLFKEQIKSGGPVTVTHPDVTRYFMTIPEAAQLVIQAGAMGENGEVFVLDMGESIKIVDLAKKMIEMSGFTVCDPATGEGDIAIEFVGLRPGEKLYEELLIGNDNVSWTIHPRIMRAEEKSIEYSVLEKALEDLKKECLLWERNAVLKRLQKLIPEYSCCCLDEDNDKGENKPLQVVRS